jgi:dihydrodipicolinate synthase/N-acetylneuraminate lyase
MPRLPPKNILDALHTGGAIPAHPLALTAERRLDERRQRALTHYYVEAGAAGVAVGVHTTQFEIRDPKVGLLKPVLALAKETLDTLEASRGERRPLVRVAGICGPTPQAVAEARLAADLGYSAGLLSLGALRDASDDALIAHARAVAEAIPLMGFYLQPAVGGRLLGAGFWRRFAQIENVVAVKLAPFNRYQTLDAIRGIAESGRAGEIALYTGNDDNIVPDLVTEFAVGGQRVRFVGGLLGQFAVWTKRAAELCAEARRAAEAGNSPPKPPNPPNGGLGGVPSLLSLGTQLTDANAVLFDAANGFRGCIPGIHEALRRVGLLEGRWCLDPQEELSPGQREEIDRVWAAYPHLRDDDFVRDNLGRWLS